MNEIDSDDFCSECKEKLEEEDFIIEYESREFWGAPCTESICVGYKCSKCGYKKDF